MAELADALDLGSSSERSTGSIPARCTKNIHKNPHLSGQIFGDFFMSIYAPSI